VSNGTLFSTPEFIMNKSTYEFDNFPPSARQQEQRRLESQEPLQIVEQKILYQAGIANAETILDVGCGTGRMAREIAVQYTRSQVIGIDRSAEIIAKARDSSNCLPNLSFRVGDVELLEFPDRSIDFVSARLLFQHLPQPLTALTEIYRILKPGGKVCILDIDESWFSLHPEPDSFRELRRTISIWQKSQGGDPCVGKKLGAYLQESQFANIHVSVEPITSDDYGLEKMSCWLSFGNPYVSLNKEVEAISKIAKKDTFDLLKLRYAWAGFGLFVAIGCK
jgi:ubiquinone/menaquinone biosynthesis C-methylase UbiE